MTALRHDIATFQTSLVIVSAVSSISFAQLNGFLLLACTGKGNFINSPVLRKLADDRIASGDRLIVVDLGACTGMDSTFMGTLAGIGRRLMALGGSMQIACPGEHNRSLLETLGLDMLLDIDPPSAVWRGKMDEYRKLLTPVDNEGVILKGKEQAIHVLDAHKVLSGINEDNAEKFKGVVDGLSQEINNK